MLDNDRRLQLWGFLPGWLHSEIFPLKIPQFPNISSIFLKCPQISSHILHFFPARLADWNNQSHPVNKWWILYSPQHTAAPCGSSAGQTASALLSPSRSPVVSQLSTWCNTSLLFLIFHFFLPASCPCGRRASSQQGCSCPGCPWRSCPCWCWSWSPPGLSPPAALAAR